MMIAGRFISGIAVGLLSAVVPMYCVSGFYDQNGLGIDLIVSPKLQLHRIEESSVVCYNGCCLGAFLLPSGSDTDASRLRATFNVSTPPHSRCPSLTRSRSGRFPLSFQVVPGIIMASGIWFLQESPRWLIEQDRHDDARAVLNKLHNNGSNDEFLELEYREIRDTIVAEKTLAVQSWSALLSRPSWRKRLFLGCGVQAFGQLSGINVGYQLAFFMTVRLTSL
jgi:hypothetical protein